jgi:2-dehydro-3-deoxy-D-arabinonate dehydratase
MGDEKVAVGLVGGELVVEVGDEARRPGIGQSGRAAVDQLFASDDPVDTARRWFEEGTTVRDATFDGMFDGAPIGTQEVWACGVTYLRSRDARMVESEQSGGDVFYDMVYDAERPEIFFKATPHRVVGPGGGVRIRRDSTWDVPEPELTLAVAPSGRIIGCTIGNDMSSRSIEGDNPLYIPQAKIYDGCAALGPRLVLGPPPGPDTGISLDIRRGGSSVFGGETTVARIKRSFEELVGYIFRDNSFPAGVFVMTGTGIVPTDDFTLAPGDEVTITIDGIGTLRNHVVVGD